MKQYFIPLLIAALIASLVVFFILPNLSPYILGALSLTMLILGVWQHYSMFPHEYKASIVTEMLFQYSGFILLGIITLGSIATIFVMNGTELPDVSNAIPEIIPNSKNNSKNNSKSNLTNAFDFGGNNSKPENAGILAAPMAAANTITNAVTNAYKNVTNTKNNSKKNNVTSPSFKVV